MDVGIIAASLIVMRPCLKAIHDAVLKLGHSQRISFAERNSHYTLSGVSGYQQDKGIIRVTKIELDSQSMSPHEITPKGLV